MMGRRNPNWPYKPHKPLPVRDNELKPNEGTKSPPKIFIERKDGSVEIITDKKSIQIR